MSYSIKTIAVFLVVIGQLQLEVRSGVFEGFGWLGKGAKNGAEGSGAARTGSRAGKEIQGADDLERVHIDPKTPDGAQRLRHETVPWTSPRAALRADGAMFPVVNRAGAITPEIETKAESCLITFLPNLFRLGAKSPKKTDTGFNVAPDKEEVHVPHSPWGFSRRLKETDEIEHGRLLSETFASLIEETPPLPLEELRDWAAAIREAFTTLPHPELEIRLHTELSNFLKLASKENPSLPVHQAVPDFKKLHEFLYDRAQLSYSHWVPPPPMELEKTWGRELLNFDKNLLVRPNFETSIGVKIQGNTVAAKTFSEINMYRLANHALVLKALNEAIDVLKDDTLVWRRSSRAPKGTINTHALDDMTAVATSLLFLYQDSLRFLKIYPKSTKLLTIVKTIEKTFANKANKEPFLYPHFMKLYEAIKNPQPAYVAPPQKTHAIS